MTFTQNPDYFYSACDNCDERKPCVRTVHSYMGETDQCGECRGHGPCATECDDCAEAREAEADAETMLGKGE